MKDVVWLSVDPVIPPDSYWDQTLLKEFFKDLNHHYEIGKLKEAIVVIPGAYQGQFIDQVNYQLKKLNQCKVIITSDEENNFPIDDLLHPNMEIYATYLTDKYQRDIKWLPIGPARMPNIEYEPKTLDWFYAGQVNHESRRKLVDVLRNNPTPYGELIETDGFAQGLPQDEYYRRMAKAKVVPAPRGNISPDSFRFYEALELGAVPIPENKDFWFKLFPDFPLEVIEDWNQLPDYINRAKDQEYRNEAVAWWKRKKFDIKRELIGEDYPTVVIPVSPIKSHPTTEIIDETINSVRLQLPHSKIIVTFDGVRDEQRHKTADYHEFIEKCLRKHDIYPIIFNKHTHQVGMMREAMKHIHSEHIVYVEQDTPFTDDYIDWEGCIQSLKWTDLIRFHFEAFIPKEHEYLMGRMIKAKVPLLRTKQYSQRPHLTTKSFYEKMLSNFSENAVSFIEDYMHSICQQFPKEYRLSIYHPEGSIKRSYHTDGRSGEEKFDGNQVF